MTVITVNAPAGRIDAAERALLALSLTDAVLEPEVGQAFAPARAGFQVWFREFALDGVAIGGKLLSEQDGIPDIMTIDVAAMDGHWPVALRGLVITRVLRALADAFRVATPAPGWWVMFRTIDEGSWGSRGGPMSILPLLETGAFSQDRIEAIKSSIGDAHSTFGHVDRDRVLDDAVMPGFGARREGES